MSDSANSTNHGNNNDHEQEQSQEQDQPVTGNVSDETTPESAGGDTAAKEDQQSSSQEETSQEETSQQGTPEPNDQEPPAGTTTPSTLFGSHELEEMKSEEQKKKDAEETEKKKRQEAAKQTGAEKTYPAGTEFRYSGHTKVLEEDMTETKIFEWVADDFPEIEKVRHTLRYDKDKGRLVPIPQAQKKGQTKGACDVGSVAAPRTLQVSTLPQAGYKPPVYRLLCEDGVYEIRTNLTGTYVVRLDSDTTLAEGYYPAVPKAPAGLLAEIVRIFKDRPETEALIDIVYNRREDTFCLVWNQKTANAGSVDYQPLPDDDNLILYAEIHSHHKMSAFFSSTDDESERGTGVYGVIGRITGELPEARFRYSCGGHFRELLAEDLFDDPSTIARTVKRPNHGDCGSYTTHGGLS